MEAHCGSLFPAKRSVNDKIPKELCSPRYITIDDAVDHIVSLGPGITLHKINRYEESLLAPHLFMQQIIIF